LESLVQPLTLYRRIKLKYQDSLGFNLQLNFLFAE
jgi:hypothetical protein